MVLGILKGKEKAIALKPPVPFDTLYNTPVTQQKGYYPTWLEFAAQNFEQIVKNSGATEVMYTVPKNFILFVTNAAASLSGNAIGAAVATIRAFDAGGSTSIILAHTAAANASAAATQTQNFNFPLKIPSDFLIRSTISNATNANVNFVGFLVPFVV